MSSERWREPVQVIEASPHPLELVQMPDGRVLRGAEIILAKEGIERIRLGRVCARCFEPFERAWPARCPVCNFAVANEQAAFFAREFGGEVVVGPRRTLADEQEGIRERAEREGI